VSTKLQFSDNQEFRKWGSVSTIFKKLKENQNNSESIVESYSPEVLLSRLSFSHFIELIRTDDPLKRAFYEVQTIKNNWGVRDLNGQVYTHKDVENYF
jgi:hypothetical protein